MLRTYPGVGVALGVSVGVGVGGTGVGLGLGVTKYLAIPTLGKTPSIGTTATPMYCNLNLPFSRRCNSPSTVMPSNATNRPPIRIDPLWPAPVSKTNSWLEDLFEMMS